MKMNSFIHNKPPYNVRARPNADSSHSLLKRAAKGSLLSLFGILVGRGALFIIRVIVTRLFGATCFGLLMIGSMVTEFTRVLASIGLPRGGMRFVSVSIGSKRYDRLPGIFGTAILVPFFFSLFLSFLVYVLSKTISTTWFQNVELVFVLRIFAVGIPFVTILKVGLDLSRGFNTTKYSVFVENLFSPFSTIALFCSFYILGKGFNSIL